MRLKFNALEAIEKNRAAIEGAIREACKKSLENDHLQGWRYGVEIDNNDVWVFGPQSQNSQSESSWNGNSYVIYIVNCSDPTDGVDIVGEILCCAEIVLPDCDWDYDQKYDWLYQNHREYYNEAIENIIDNLVNELDVDQIIEEEVRRIKF